jgi:hypothetical protein
MRRAPAWIERLARIGIVAKAIIYLAIGTLATRVALEAGGALTGGEGVLRMLVSQPMGRLALIVLAFGFAAYTLWLFAQAVVDPDGNGTGFVGIVNRTGQIITGIAQVTLTWEALRLALGIAGGRSAGVEGLVGALLRAPFAVTGGSERSIPHVTGGRSGWAGTVSPPAGWSWAWPACW